MKQILLKAPEVADVLGISERSFYQLRKQHSDFPDAVELGARQVRWRASDIEAWVTGLRTKPPRGEPLHLAIGRLAARQKGTPPTPAPSEAFEALTQLGRQPSPATKGAA